MPPVIPAAAAAFAGGLAAEAGFGVFASSLFAAGAGFVSGAAITSLTKPGRQQALPTYQAEARDRQIIVRSAVEPRRVVYGTAAVSGPLVYAETTGSNNEFLHLVIPLAGHEVESIDTVVFDDEVVPLDASGNAGGRFTQDTPTATTHTASLPQAGSPVTVPGADVLAVESVTINYQGNVFTCFPLRVASAADAVAMTDPNNFLTCFHVGNDFYFSGTPQVLPGATVTISYFTTVANSFVRVKKHLGADDQTADSDLVAESGGQWTTAHRLRGIAYLYVRLEFDERVFPSGIPNIKAVVRGKKLYDPRGGSPTLVQWSNNWALVVRDYLASSYGLACDEDEIDDALIIAAANICDESVDLQAGSPSDSHKRYTANGTINLADRPVDILRQLLSAGAGAAVFTEGDWKVYAGAYVTPTVDIDEDWLRGPVKVRAKPPRRELFNGVRGTYTNPDKFWQPTDFPVVTNSTYESQDGGQQILRDIELPFTIAPARAQRIAKIHLEKARQGIVVELPCNLKAFQVAVWDNVRLTLDVFGWEAKVFKVLEWTFSQDGGVDLVLQEEASTVYDWAAGEATSVDPAPDTTLPDAFGNLDPSSLTATSGTADLFRQGDGTIIPRIRLRWTQPTNPFVKYYEVQFSRLDSSPTEWVDAPDVASPALEAFCHPVQDGVTYDVRIRAVTTIGNPSNWAYVRGHTVVGKTEPPSDVTNATASQNGDVVVFACDTVTDDDLDLIEVRWLDFGDTEWNNGVPVANILRGQELPSASIPQGDWTFLFKAKDTSGNYSTNAARADLTVTADGFSTIESRQDAPDWIGTRDNFVVSVSGALIPDSTKLASEHTNAELFEQFVPYPEATCTYTAPEMDKGRDGVARIYADIVSVLGPGVVTGTSSPKHRVDYKTASGAYDGYEDWKIGAVNFRYASSQIVLDTSVGKSKITGFSTVIDKRTRSETGTFTTDAGGSLAVTFTEPFHNTPTLSVTPQGSGNVSASYDSVSETGFTGYFKSGGAAAAGTASYHATGA